MKKKVRQNLARKSRRKGHNFERQLVKEFKELGYKDCKTSRYASRELDAMGIDLCNIPYNIQAKNVKAAIKYPDLIKEIEDNVKGTNREKYPAIIFHKRGRRNYEELVVMTKYEFMRLIKLVIKLLA